MGEPYPDSEFWDNDDYIVGAAPAITDDTISLTAAILDTIAEWELEVADLRAEANLIEAHARLLADILYPEEIGGNQ